MDFFWINAAKGLCYWGWNKLYYLSKSLKNINYFCVVSVQKSRI